MEETQFKIIETTVVKNKKGDTVVNVVFRNKKGYLQSVNLTEYDITKKAYENYKFYQENKTEENK